MRNLPALLIAAAIGATCMGAAYAASPADTPTKAAIERPAPVLPVVPSQSVRLVPSNVEITVQTIETATVAVARPPALRAEAAPVTTTSSSTTQMPTAEPEPLPERTDPAQPPITSPPPPPTAEPPIQPIIPIVIAYDGVKCAKSESWREPASSGTPLLMCPLSRKP